MSQGILSVRGILRCQSLLGPNCATPKLKQGRGMGTDLGEAVGRVLVEMGTPGPPPEGDRVFLRAGGANRAGSEGVP